MKTKTILKSDKIEICFGVFWPELRLFINDDLGDGELNSTFVISLILIHLYLCLPGHKHYCNYRFGFRFTDYQSSNIPCALVWYWKSDSKLIYMPWQLEWYRTSYLLWNNQWAHDTLPDRTKWLKKHPGSCAVEYSEKVTMSYHSNPAAWEGVYPYTYVLSNGKEQHTMAHVKVVEREWRPQWFMWTNVFAKTKRIIEIDFEEEIGEQTGSWTGGVVGCAYDMLPNETPEQCLKRMEVERRFD